MPHKFVAIAGNIGSGKSCLTEFLCKQYGMKPFYEPNDINPYLADFYQNMRKWAFHSQLHFLSQKHRIHQELEQCNDIDIVVQDRTIYEDSEIFAQNLFKSGYMTKRDFETYYALYESIRNKLRPPDVLIYLDCNIRTLKKRIKLRGRKMEQKVPTPYLKALNNLYELWVGKYKLSPVVKICTEPYDYMDDFIERQRICKKIEKYL